MDDASPNLAEILQHGHTLSEFGVDQQTAYLGIRARLPDNDIAELCALIVPILKANYP
jgi:hypothetical protein